MQDIRTRQRIPFESFEPRMLLSVGGDVTVHPSVMPMPTAGAFDTAPVVSVHLRHDVAIARRADVGPGSVPTKLAGALVPAAGNFVVSLVTAQDNAVQTLLVVPTEYGLAIISLGSRAFPARFVPPRPVTSEPPDVPVTQDPAPGTPVPTPTPSAPQGAVGGGSVVTDGQTVVRAPDAPNVAATVARALPSQAADVLNVVNSLTVAPTAAVQFRSLAGDVAASGAVGAASAVRGMWSDQSVMLYLTDISGISRTYEAFAAAVVPVAAETAAAVADSAADAVVSDLAAAAAVAESLASVTQVYEFAHLGSPLLLLADSVGAFVEESARVELAGTLTEAHPHRAWLITLLVLGADIAIVTHYYRKGRLTKTTRRRIAAPLPA